MPSPQGNYYNRREQYLLRYSSIKEIVTTITKIENTILPEYKGTVNVFRNVKSELESLIIKHKVIEDANSLK